MAVGTSLNERIMAFSRPSKNKRRRKNIRNFVTIKRANNEDIDTLQRR